MVQQDYWVPLKDNSMAQTMTTEGEQTNAQWSQHLMWG